VGVPPETRYARSGDVYIAYQVVGKEGELDLVLIPSLALHVELRWEIPPIARTLDSLAGLGRLIVFDKRGTGMSDRVSSDTTLETRMDDIRAVMAAAGSERAGVCAVGEGAPHAILFAATYPERTAGLVLINGTPRFTRSTEFPWLHPRAEREQTNEEMVDAWGDQIRQRDRRPHRSCGRSGRSARLEHRQGCRRRLRNQLSRSRQPRTQRRRRRMAPLRRPTLDG
jgi:pimeloyl-ACP methyl ester carboxylesterase